MVEPTKRLVEHAYFSKRVSAKEGEKARVSFSMTLTDCLISDEQMGKLQAILSKAAEDAEATMGW